jgi:hypothetical protein
MKTLRNNWLTLLVILSSGLMLARAADTRSTGVETKPPIHPTVDPTLAAEFEAAEQQPTIPADTLPLHSPGSWFSAQAPWLPPAPANFVGVSYWSLGGNAYLLSDVGIDYSALATVAKAEMISDKSGGFSPKISGGPAMPYLTIAPTGTNQLLLTVINTNPATYYLQTTPALANANYPWTIITNGTANQTNFIVNIGPYADSFFRVFTATNNPGQGVIAVFIDSPANGATVQ